jgi:hypothetical protein
LTPRQNDLIQRQKNFNIRRILIFQAANSLTFRCSRFKLFNQRPNTLPLCARLYNSRMIPHDFKPSSQRIVLNPSRNAASFTGKSCAAISSPASASAAFLF